MEKQPSNQDIVNILLRMDGEIGEVKNHIVRLDSKIEAVHRTLKNSIEETVAMFNGFATQMEVRVRALEARHV